MYIGHAGNDFKSSFINHKAFFNNHNHKNASGLSKKIWEIKENGIDYNITRNIIDKAKAYQEGSRTGNLCFSEKFYIISSKNTINQKSNNIEMSSQAKISPRIIYILNISFLSDYYY